MRSPYSTMQITKNDALGIIMKKLLTATDEQIEDMLFDLVGRDWLNNFIIVNEYDDVEEDSYEYYLQYKNVKHIKE